MSLLKCGVSDLFSNTARVASSDELMNLKSQFLNSECKNRLLYDQLSICIFQKQNCYIGKLSHFCCVQRTSDV